jgi:hypothetical protein
MIAGGWPTGGVQFTSTVASIALDPATRAGTTSTNTSYIAVSDSIPDPDNPIWIEDNKSSNLTHTKLRDQGDWQRRRLK